MDDAKAAAEIKYLVDHHVYLVPTFIEKAMGLQKGWGRFELEDRKLFGNEALQVYYPDERSLTLLCNYANPFTRVRATARSRERVRQCPAIPQDVSRGWRQGARRHRRR